MDTETQAVFDAAQFAMNWHYPESSTGIGWRGLRVALQAHAKAHPSHAPEPAKAEYLEWKKDGPDDGCRVVDQATYDLVVNAAEFVEWGTNPKQCEDYLNRFELLRLSVGQFGRVCPPPPGSPLPPCESHPCAAMEAQPPEPGAECTKCRATRWWNPAMCFSCPRRGKSPPNETAPKGPTLAGWQTVDFEYRIGDKVRMTPSDKTSKVAGQVGEVCWLRLWGNGRRTFGVYCCSAPWGEPIELTAAELPIAPTKVLLNHDEAMKLQCNDCGWSGSKSPPPKTVDS